MKREPIKQSEDYGDFAQGVEDNRNSREQQGGNRLYQLGLWAGEKLTEQKRRSRYDDDDGGDEDDKD